ncbi:MAG TPA: proline dehydrogenase family protein [Tetrasphaera sp.]|uniref:proline dehydrogenase family protein n=1 Tax=Nostocoides sp. TaxID=1917966 RepID=UPI002B5FFA5A|nr:proline dehydrogenase family protein [Tetrasphaera sp.]HNQ07731.1 proline dehydrogenase family protein [Tetrasphaera sp.]
MGPAELLRKSLLTLADSGRVRDIVERAPVSRSVVKRYVPGAYAADVVTAVADLGANGRAATIDYLGEYTTDVEQAEATTQAYLDLLRLLADEGLTSEGRAEVSVKLSAIGQSLPADGPAIALENARTICSAARAAGTTVTLDMEDHTTTDATLEALHALRADFSFVGVAIQAYLHRTEGDCRDLATDGSRVRLCKGAYAEPASVAYQDADDVAKSYVRCLKVLLAGPGYPMIATHDPRLVEIAAALTRHHGRPTDSYEFQMLYGVRPEEQRRIADRGNQMRVYVPYGEEWYGYLMRRMAERPANAFLFARSLISRN